MNYSKPMMQPLNVETGACSCNFHQSNSGNCGIRIGNLAGGLPPVITTPIAGGCVGVNAGQTQVDPSAINATPILTNTIVGVDDNGVSVTPLAGTGLPGTQPIDIYAPIGTHGIYADVRLLSASYAIDPHGFGATVLGQTLSFGLP